MTETVDIIFAISMLIGGLIMTMIGFDIIKLKAKKQEDEERLKIWKIKFGRFFRIGGIVILIIGIFLIIIPDFNPESKTWTKSQKIEMKKEIINSSNTLKSMNPDTADLVVTCFVEKYTDKFTLQESWDQENMTDDQIGNLTMLMMNECFELYGIKTNK